MKWFGALLVVGSCGGFGCSIASAHRYQNHLLRQLQGILKLMEWELSCRLTALPELFRIAEAHAEERCLKNVFRDLGCEISKGTEPDACACMRAVITRNQELPPKVRRCLRYLGTMLGRFDLEGQLQGIRSVEKEIQRLLQNSGKEQEQRVRSYQTLCLCAGLALAVLLV